eukprot:232110_1
MLHTVGCVYDKINKGIKLVNDQYDMQNRQYNSIQLLISSSLYNNTLQNNGNDKYKIKMLLGLSEKRDVEKDIRLNSVKLSLDESEICIGNNDNIFCYKLSVYSLLCTLIIPV